MFPVIDLPAFVTKVVLLDGMALFATKVILLLNVFFLSRTQTRIYAILNAYNMCTMFILLWAYIRLKFKKKKNLLKRSVSCQT